MYTCPDSILANTSLNTKEGKSKQRQTHNIMELEIPEVIHLYTHVHCGHTMYTYKYTCISMYTCTCMYTKTHVQCLCTCTHVYIHTQMYMYSRCLNIICNVQYCITAADKYTAVVNLCFFFINSVLWKHIVCRGTYSVKLKSNPFQLAPERLPGAVLALSPSCLCHTLPVQKPTLQN